MLNVVILVIYQLFKSQEAGCTRGSVSIHAVSINDRRALEDKTLIRLTLEVRQCDFSLKIKNILCYHNSNSKAINGIAYSLCQNFRERVIPVRW